METTLAVIGRQAACWENASALESGLLTTLDLTSPVGLKRAYNVMQGEDLRAENVIGDILLVADVLIHGVAFENRETGEMSHALRTVLILPDGGTIACVSDGVVRSIMRLASLGLKPPFVPPLECRIVKKKSGATRTYYSLELI